MQTFYNLNNSEYWMVNNAKVKTLIMHIHQIKWVILNTSDLKHLVTCTSLHVYCPFLIHKNLCLLFWRFHVFFTPIVFLSFTLCFTHLSLHLSPYIILFSNQPLSVNHPTPFFLSSSLHVPPCVRFLSFLFYSVFIFHSLSIYLSDLIYFRILTQLNRCLRRPRNDEKIKSGKAAQFPSVVL